MSKRKFSKKEVAISIAAAALAIATVGGAVAIHKDSSNSNTGHSITVEQSDYSKKKEEAIQQIQDTVKDLSDDQQSEIDSYIKQNIENIQKAESERTIESTLQETLDYIDQRSLSEKEEQRKETQTTETSSSSEREVTSSSVSEEDKYHILGEDYIYENNDYLPVINQSNWIYMSDEEKDDWLKKCTPVKKIPPTLSQPYVQTLMVTIKAGFFAADCINGSRKTISQQRKVNIWPMEPINQVRKHSISY